MKNKILNLNLLLIVLLITTSAVRSIINRQIQLDLLANTTTIVIIKKKKMNKIIIVVVCDASWSMKQFCNDMMDYLQETDGENEKLNEETNALVLNPFVLK